MARRPALWLLSTLGIVAAEGTALLLIKIPFVEPEPFSQHYSGIACPGGPKVLLWMAAGADRWPPVSPSSARRAGGPG